jgi:hypothetical protein
MASKKINLGKEKTKEPDYLRYAILDHVIK